MREVTSLNEFARIRRQRSTSPPLKMRGMGPRKLLSLKALATRQGKRAVRWRRDELEIGRTQVRVGTRTRGTPISTCDERQAWMANSWKGFPFNWKGLER